MHSTNSFHVAMRLFSNRSQMMSKCGKNKRKKGGAQGNSQVCHWCSKCHWQQKGNQCVTNMHLHKHLLSKKTATKAKRTYETKIKKFEKFIYKHNTDL